MGRRRQNRFDVYDERSNMGCVERSGIVNSREDFELGTASLERRENVVFLAANSRGESLAVSIKWRPSAKDKRVVSLSTRFELQWEGRSFEHQQVLSYEPQRSPIWPEFITQYGGQQSSVKFFVAAPYRRMRLTFQGHVSDRRSGESKFIKAGFVVSPTSGIVDLLKQHDAKFIKKQLAANRSLERKDSAGGAGALLAHNRHEQLVQIKGDFTVIDSHGARSKQRLYSWGFYIRHFVGAHKQANTCPEQTGLTTDRVLAHFKNGRAFHIGQRCASAGAMQFGYMASFGSAPSPVESCRADWAKMAGQPTTTELNCELVSQSKEFKCVISQRDDGSGGGWSGFCDAKLNGVAGWAWLFRGANDEEGEPSASLEERELIERSAREFIEARESGRLAKVLTFRDHFGPKRPLIVRIDERMCECSDLVGAKAASLAQLRLFSSLNLNANYLVPGGFVLTRFAHDAVLEANGQLKQEIAKLEWLMGEGDLSTLGDECERLQQLVAAASLPDEVRAELAAYIETNYPEDGATRCFAVRSSSWGEDEDDMSAAGQLSTILGVRGLESIFGAVMRCFASKFTVANIEYKRQHGLPAGLPMAVVVQEMVDCEKAGVMFTCDPTTGDESRITITANYGLGESVVSGQSEPDTITVFKPSSGDEKDDPSEPQITMEIVVGAKTIVIDSETLRGEENEREGQYDRSKCCLSEAEILNLAKSGQAIAHYFQCPRDIEWGFKGNQLYLLQSRPVTGVDACSEFELMHENDQPSAAEEEYCTRANIGEVIPFAMKPMTLTCVFKVWAVFSARLSARMSKGNKSSAFECARDMTLVAYHAFFNLRGPMLNIRSKGGDKHKHSKQFEVSILGRELEDEPEMRAALEEFAVEPPGALAMQMLKLVTIDLRLAPMQTVKSIKRSLAEARKGLRELKFATGYHQNKMIGLFNQMKHMFGIGYGAWRAHGLTFMICKEHNMALAEALSKHLNNDRTKVSIAIAKFLAMSPDVLSAEIPQRIDRMAKMIKRIGRSEVDRFLSLTPDEAVNYLLKGDDDKLTAEFESFLEKFGHRCYHEFDVGSREWAAERSAVAEMIKRNCLVEDDIITKKLMTTDEIIDSLGLRNLSKKDLFMLKYLLVPNCQLFVSVRERTKDVLIEFTNLLRLSSRMLAKELRRNLRIPDEDLFYYLNFDEISPLIREPQPSIVVQAVRRRQLFNTAFKDPWRFDDIIRGYELIPNHMKPSKELDEKIANAPKLVGTPASSGQVRGKICLVDGYKDLGKIKPGDILLTHSTDIAFSPVFPMISGIITEVGGLVSHGAVVAREYGLPSVLGIPNVTRILQDGEEIVLDADIGTIIRINLMKSD